MKKGVKLVALAVLLSQISGCGGDSFASLFHETMAIYNELADNMIFVCDENSAEYFTKVKMEKLNKRWGALNGRVQDFLKRTDADNNPKIKFEVANLFVDYSLEYVSVLNRIKEQVDRINAIRYKVYLDRYPQYQDPQFKGAFKVADLGRECPKLTEAMAAPNSFALNTLMPDNPFEAKEGGTGMPMPGMPGGGMPGMPGGGMPGMPGGGMPGGGMPGGGMPRP